MSIGKAAILLASLQQQGKLRQLLGTCVEVDAPEVVAEDVLHCLATVVALFEVNLIEQVERLVEDVARTASKVGTSQLMDVIKLEDAVGRRLLGRLHQILHPLLNLRIRVVVQIDASHRVLHHVLHNPVGRKDLRSCWNILRLRLLALLERGKHIVLLLSNIELIEPAYQFGRMKILLADKGRIVEHTHKATFRQDVLWQKQLCVVGNGSEALVDDRILMAISHYEQGELLVGLAVVVKESHQFVMHVGCHLRHTSLARLANNDRHTHLLAFVSQDRRDETLLLHDAYSHEAVEPCVGCLFCHLLDAASADIVIERHPTAVKVSRYGVAHEYSTALHLLWHFSGFASLQVEAYSLQAVFHALHQYISSLGSEAFQSVSIHII